HRGQPAEQPPEQDVELRDADEATLVLEPGLGDEFDRNPAVMRGGRFAIAHRERNGGAPHDIVGGLVDEARTAGLPVQRLDGCELDRPPPLSERIDFAKRDHEVRKELLRPAYKHQLEGKKTAGLHYRSRLRVARPRPSGGDHKRPRNLLVRAQRLRPRRGRTLEDAMVGALPRNRAFATGGRRTRDRPEYMAECPAQRGAEV